MIHAPPREGWKGPDRRSGRFLMPPLPSWKGRGEGKTMCPERWSRPLEENRSGPPWRQERRPLRRKRSRGWCRRLRAI